MDARELQICSSIRSASTEKRPICGMLNCSAFTQRATPSIQSQNMKVEMLLSTSIVLSAILQLFLFYSLDIFRINAFFVGKNVRKAVDEGRADFTPVFLSEIPNLFRREVINLDVCLVTVRRLGIFWNQKKIQENSLSLNMRSVF